jgi:hypothetical protein
MLQENLKQKSLDDLLQLLAVSQRNLALSRLYNQGADVIQQNKNHLEKVQKAIVEKRGDPLPAERIK